MNEEELEQATLELIDATDACLVVVLKSDGQATISGNGMSQREAASALMSLALELGGNPTDE
jgi:hypothetical protein